MDPRKNTSPDNEIAGCSIMPMSICFRQGFSKSTDFLYKISRKKVTLHPPLQGMGHIFAADEGLSASRFWSIDIPMPMTEFDTFLEVGSTCLDL